MSVQVRDRVALQRAPEWQGTVDRIRSGVAEVLFDGGGHGRFPVADLVKVEDKAWPPGNLETK